MPVPLGTKVTGTLGQFFYPASRYIRLWSGPPINAPGVIQYPLDTDLAVYRNHIWSLQKPSDADNTSQFKVQTERLILRYDTCHGSNSDVFRVKSRRNEAAPLGSMLFAGKPVLERDRYVRSS